MMKVKCNSCHVYRDQEAFLGINDRIVKSCKFCRDRSHANYNKNSGVVKQYYVDHKLEKLLYARSNPDYVIAQKINNYKREDRARGRVFTDDEYVTPEWVGGRLTECDNHCELCHKQLKIAGYASYDQDQFSIDRIHNRFAHIKSNCMITCLECNLKRVGQN